MLPPIRNDTDNGVHCMLLINDSFPVIKVDNLCTIVDCNARACEFFGLEIEEIQGKHIADYLDTDCGLEGSFSGESEYIISRFHHYTGSVSDVVIVRNRDSRQREQFHFLTIFDVSSSRPVVDNTRSESVKNIAGRMAHDFNNILAGILGSLSILREGDLTGNEYDELINNAEEGVIRARRITDKMLLFSRGGVNPVPDTMPELSHLEKQDDSDVKSDSERLLLLDDNPFVASTTIGMLVTLGYIVDVVSEGREVLAKYRVAMKEGNSYKVVIMDLTIEGGSGGLETISSLLKIDPEAVVILSSGFSGSNTMLNYRSLGFKASLAKPYTVRELFEALNTALGH